MTSEIYAALSAAQAEFPPIAKTRTATVRSEKGTYSYNYADLSDVIAAVRPSLGKHKLSISQPVETLENGRVVLRSIVAHASGETLQAVMPLPAFPDNARMVQGWASMLTYARRYHLTSLLGVVAEEDDDGTAATDPGPTERGSRPAPQSPSRHQAPARPAASAPRAVEPPANDGQADPAKIRHLEPSEAAGTLKFYLGQAAPAQADAAWEAYKPWVKSWAGVKGRNGDTLTGVQLAELFDRMVADRISSVAAAE